ncbi:hypothetical protein CPB83DRAFT_856618 [Crepidotus variabilis]|uniref:ferric-chelate reductase (NADPH) n=1 Tax=Crepidotus variabilis TaxID=179855 RepID=A0A9P6EE02_9AGAR|nr:hypothetical protein CPB83DRAFT_856618 [Crepidotus variabilis]
MSNFTAFEVVGGPAHNLSDFALVFHVNLLIISVIAAIAVVRLPRAFALFGTPREWIDGHFLRYVPYKPSRQFVQAAHLTYPPPDKEYTDSSSDDSHSSSGYSYRVQPQRLTVTGLPVEVQYPPHVAAWFKPLRPVLTTLRIRIAPGFSVGQFIILTIWFYSLVYATFFDSNIITDNSRTGWIAVGQLAFVYAFAQKNNILGGMLGYGYEKVNFLHRFSGRIVVLASNVHSFHYFYKWTLEGSFKQNMANPHRIMGVIALLCMDILYLFSIKFVRDRSYNLFYRSHLICLALVLPATYFHKTATLPYLFACVAIYGFDRVIRVFKTRISNAYIRPLPELDVTRVEIPNVNAGWRAGQHIRLRVLSLQMGWLGWTESHPFTVASVSHGPEGMVLMCKRAGGWTRSLFDMAKLTSYTEGGTGRNVKVAVEGPYGGPKHTIFSSFSAAVFIAGGSGITYALTAIQDLVQKDLQGQSRVKIIELVWTLPEPSGLAPILPTLISLVHQSVFTPIRISIFYTRAPTGIQPAFFAFSESPVLSASPIPAVLNRISGHEKQRSGSRQALRNGSPGSSPSTSPPPRNHPSSPSYFPPNMSLAPGRPKYSKIMEGAIQRAVTLGAGVKDDERITGVVVGVCGPIEMADDVARAVGSIEATRRDQVGGIELCEEVFGW